jgi:hypothetical protein
MAVKIVEMQAAELAAKPGFVAAISQMLYWPVCMKVTFQFVASKTGCQIYRNKIWEIFPSWFLQVTNQNVHPMCYSTHF